MQDSNYLKLCLVTHFSSTSIQHYERFIQIAAFSGVTSVQFRCKNKTYSELRYLALMIQSVLKPLKIPLIINDYVDLAKEINADGVHLGQSDMTPEAARHILGDNKIIGLSVESFEDLAKANRLTCINYVAASAIFPTPSKSDCKIFWGIEGLKKLIQQSFHPVIAIGGIDINTISEVMQTGASGVAMIHAIHNHPDPGKLIPILIKKINQFGKIYV